MKILITGGCGFLGSNLASYGALAGCEILVFDNLSRNGSSKNREWLSSHANIQFIEGDVSEFQQVSDVISYFSPDAIFHLAGQVAMTTSISNPIYDMKTNIEGTVNVLESIRRENKDIKLIFSSTNKVYGDLKEYDYRVQGKRYVCDAFLNGVSEHAPLNFQSPYGCSKGAADQYVNDYHRIYGIQTVVFRHSSMYGGRQFPTEHQGWVGWFCSEYLNIALGKSLDQIRISGSGLQVRDLLHADDMCELYFAALTDFNKVSGNVFNIGGGMRNSLSLLELFDILGEYFSIDPEIVKGKMRVSDQKIFVADLNKIQAHIDWTPKKSFHLGLSEYLDWIKHEQ